MKVPFVRLAALVGALGALVAVSALVTPPQVATRAATSSALPALRHKGNSETNEGKLRSPLLQPLATALLGWSLMGPLAGAVPPLPIAAAPEPPMAQQVARTSSLPSQTLAEKIVELDFSLPSYSESVKGADISKAGGAPLFNPFGDFEPSKVNSDAAPAPAPSPAVEAPKAAAAESKKAAAAADRAAKESAKKAADEAKKAADEAKRAEKEARLQAEKEKQRAAVERSKQQQEEKPASVSSFEAPSFKAPDLGDFKLPDTSALKVPEMPKFDLPDTSGFKTPELPKFDLPDTKSFKAPEIPKFDLPDTSGFKAPEIPKFDMPDTSSFKAPALPKFDVPKIELPKNDYIDLGQMPKLDAPKFDFDSPKIGLPSFPSFGGGSSSSGGDVLEPQDVRDERAREARQVFLQFDGSAKEIEAQAREARNLANEKKKLANAAKDEACQTRPGGKWICLRNPFSVGY